MNRHELRALQYPTWRGDHNGIACSLFAIHMFHFLVILGASSRLRIHPMHCEAKETVMNNLDSFPVKRGPHHWTEEKHFKESLSPTTWCHRIEFLTDFKRVELRMNQELHIYLHRSRRPSVLPTKPEERHVRGKSRSAFTLLEGQCGRKLFLPLFQLLKLLPQFNPKQNPSQNIYFGSIS